MDAPLTLDEFVTRATALIGAEHVRAFSEEDRPTLAAVFGLDVPPSAIPRAIAMPGSVEELQAIVGLAGAAGYSVWSQPNAQGNGASAGNPDKPGVIVNLARMNRILEFDRESAYALLEPGVSFDDLAAYIAEHALPFWIDCTANGADSVLGSIIDRDVGHTPYGDHLLMQCGFEVVTANGALTRTGMGSLPGNDTWQLFKYNFGPYLDGLFSRADFGVVSKAGIWMMPAPAAFHPFMVTLPDQRALGAAVELLRPLRIAQSIPGNVVISHIDADLQLAATARPAATVDIRAMQEAGTLATWNLYAALYGLPENVAASWDALAPALAALPGARVFSEADRRDDVVWQLRRDLMRGRPAYSLAATARPLAMSFTLACAPEDNLARQLYQHVEGILHDRDIAWQAEFVMTWRTLLLRGVVPVSVDNHVEIRLAVLEVLRHVGKAGFGITHECSELRTPVAEMQTSPAMQQLYAQIGQALDPTGVLGARKPPAS